MVVRLHALVAWGLLTILVACATATESTDVLSADALPDSAADPGLHDVVPVEPDAGPEPVVPGTDGPELGPETATEPAVEPLADVPASNEIEGDEASTGFDAADPGTDPGPVVAPTLSVTVNAVPPEMNGSIPFLDNDFVEKPFHLAVPPRGFTVDVTILPGSAALDPASLGVTADVAVGDLAAGANLGQRFAWSDANHATWLVDLDFPLAWPVTVTARVADTNGVASSDAAVAFEVRELTPGLDPFEKVDLWLLDFRRDAWSIAVAETADDFTVTSTEGANGVGDFDEMLAVLGFLGPDPAFNAAFVARFRDEMRANLNKMFLLSPDGALSDGSVRVRLVFDGEPDAPDPAEYVEGGSFSMMAIGGDSLNADGTPTGYLGMAWLDWNNTGVDDNTDPGHGVFFTALMRKTAGLAGLKPLLGLTVPATGTPLGGLPDDLLLLDPGYTPPNDADLLHKKRSTLVKLFFKVGGIGLAALTAHEMGHSLGLVAPGAPPKGLFGGACEAAFVNSCSDGAHVDTAGANLMQSGKSLNVGDFLTTYPRFEPLSLAYLQRRLVVDPLF